MNEVLFDAGLFPFKKLASLSKDEQASLHEAVYSVPVNAIPVLQERMGDDIHRKVRDFLKVHGKGNQPCSTSGTNITHITSNGHLRTTARSSNRARSSAEVRCSDSKYALALAPNRSVGRVYSLNYKGGATA